MSLLRGSTKPGLSVDVTRITNASFTPLPPCWTAAAVSWMEKKSRIHQTLGFRARSLPAVARGGNSRRNQFSGTVINYGHSGITTADVRN